MECFGSWDHLAGNVLDKRTANNMSIKAKKSLYGVLGVASWADLEAIRKAYQRKVKECHPDRFPDKAEEFKAVQEAWDVLGNEEKRAYYDEHGEVPNGGKAD